MLSIFKKEISGFFNSLIAYMVIIVFLTFIGLYMWVFPESSVLEYGFADLESLFTFGPVAYLLLIPAITMRTFAEEKKDGTIEMLLTKPVTDWDIILGKYFSSLSLVVFSLIPTLIYYYSVYNLGNPAGNVDSAAVFTSYIGLILLGAVFTSVGLFASSVSQNQIVAFILSVILCYVLYDGIARIATLDLWQGTASFIASIGLDYHYNALSKGVVDSRNVFYFISVIVTMLVSSHLILGSRKW
ncbi:MAG TPA: gliding motility-associated ABC transporter permease subunit GldF [Cytophagaceae bacterium]